MTEYQALHLIEQFAAQSPFALWITDSRGVTIFANQKLHDLFEIPAHPSGAIGINLFDDPAVGHLGLESLAKKLMAGEPIDTTLDIEHPHEIGSSVPIGRKLRLSIRVIAYALRSSTQKIEHYVIIFEDLTEARAQQKKLHEQMRSMGIYSSSKSARETKLKGLEEEVEELEKNIRELGATPLA